MATEGAMITMLLLLWDEGNHQSKVKKLIFFVAVVKVKLSHPIIIVESVKFCPVLLFFCLLTALPKVRNWVNSNFEVRTKLFKKIIIFKKEVYTRVILFNLINYHPSTKDGHKLNLKKIPHINKIKRKLALKFMCQYSVVVALLQKRKAWVPYDQNNNVPKARQKWFYVFICLLPFLISEDWSLIVIRVISTSSKSF